MNDPAISPGIGTLAEKSLHAALKRWYARPGDLFEQRVAGYVIDILRENELVEIQTRQFYKLRTKILNLLAQGYPVRLVHPIRSEKWIIRETLEGEQISRRKSPKRGQLIHIFSELVNCTDLLKMQGFILEVVLVQVEEHWRDDGRGSWRRKGWSLFDHHLVGVIARHEFKTQTDYLKLLPPDLTSPFTNRNLAQMAGCPLRLASQVTRTLSRIGLLKIEGRQNRAYLYQKVDHS